LARVLIDYKSYPFLINLREALEVKYPGLRIEDVISLTDNYPRRRSLYLLKTIITKGYIVEGSGTSEDETLVFYSLLIGAKALNDKKLISKIALSYAKYSSRKLSKEPIPLIIMIARKLGLDAEVVKNPPRIPIGVKKRKAEYITKPIAIPVKQYLRLTASRLARDPKYSLANQIVDNGKVFIDRDIMIRLIEEEIFKKILEMADSIEYDINKLSSYLDEYKKILEETRWFERKGLDLEKAKVIGYNPKALPPCMKNLISRLENGDNLSHHERFTVAAFLTNIGLDTDTILEFFKNTPDYNEKIARYQVEHIAGLRGSRKKYLPYNCDTMKSLGICPINNYCGKGRNPLTIYYYNIRKMKDREEVVEN